jgi:hypothetical protein
MRPQAELLKRLPLLAAVKLFAIPSHSQWIACPSLIADIDKSARRNSFVSRSLQFNPDPDARLVEVAFDGFRYLMYRNFFPPAFYFPLEPEVRKSHPN